MRWAVGLIALLTLVGCDGAIQACDREIKGKLQAPSTYDRISAEKKDIYGGTVVTVEYEAENAFGVPLRQIDSCTIPN